MEDEQKGGDYLNLVTNRAGRGDDGADDAYGIVTGQRTAAVLRFIRQGGKPFSMPYGLLPIVWGDYLPGMLLIEYAGFFTVRLTGEGLAPLEPLVSEHRVTWIRACGEAAARLPLAVTAIDILRYYPSRQFAIDPEGFKLEAT